MRILVTGGCGFIGSNLIRRIFEVTDHKVTNLDALTYAADPSALAEFEGDERYRFLEGDITDPVAVGDAIAGCDAVIHTAAETFVDRSLNRPAEFVATNVLGTQILLTAARDAEVSRFVHVSTDEVYGSCAKGRFDEAAPLEPTSPYSASKAGSDLIALAAHRTYGQEVIVTRCTNNYGPRQHLEKLIPLFVTNLLDGAAVPIYGDGHQVRDWLFVTDHADALLLLLDAGRAGEIYNIGAEQDPEWDNLMIAQALTSLTGVGDDLLQFVDDRPGHDQRYAVSSAKIRALGWAPTHDLESGLASTVDWYRSNRDWWEGRVSSERTIPAHLTAGVTE